MNLRTCTIDDHDIRQRSRPTFSVFDILIALMHFSFE